MDNITVEQIDTMKHAIGFSKNRTTGVKHRVMYAFRNRYHTFADDLNMQSLRKLGLVEHGAANEQGHCTFWVTEKGFEFLANLCGFEKIVEDE